MVKKDSDKGDDCCWNSASLYDAISDLSWRVSTYNQRQIDENQDVKIGSVPISPN